MGASCRITSRRHRREGEMVKGEKKKLQAFPWMELLSKLWGGLRDLVKGQPPAPLAFQTGRWFSEGPQLSLWPTWELLFLTVYNFSLCRFIYSRADNMRDFLTHFH